MSEEDGGISQFSHLSYIEKNGEVNGLLSNQILQRTINEIGDIIECNCSIWNTDGVMLAAVGKEKPAVKKAVCSFLKELEVTGVSEVIEHNNEIDVHTSGRLSVCQLESLLRSGSERLDRNRFIQNLLLDNLLLVDIYNQAKKLGITVEQRRVVYLIEPKNPDDTIVLDMIRGIYSSGTGDFVTAVDEGHIILIKSLDSTDDYDTIRSTADMLVNAINTEAMVNVRISFGTIIPELKEVSQSYKEAGMALDVGRIFYPERNILSYRELGIGRLIHQLPVSLCEMFLEEVFAGNTVDQFDEETLSTVDKFFENSLNISETARQLFVHRNTLVYRLEKIQKQTGLDVRVFEDALTFKIALMVADHMKFIENRK